MTLSRRTLVLAFIGGVLAFGGAVLASDELPPADQPVTMKRDKGNEWFFQLHDSFIQRTNKGRIGILFLGDSITQGWKLAPDIWEKYYAQYDPANFGISGNHTQDVLWRIENGELDGISPDVLVLEIGTNNHDYPAVDIVRADEKIIRSIHKKLPKTKVLVLGIFPRGADPKDPAVATLRAKLVQVNEELAKLDDGQQTRYLDIGGKLIEVDGTISKDLMADGLHPTPKGYQIWAEAMQPLLQEMMKH